MKKTVSFVCLFVLAGAFAAAQTFNPRVEVENTFEGKIVEAAKLPLGMNVPDSLYKFQYQLDYTVFDNPYQGSYKFQPYRIEMRPDAAPSRARRLYVNLGAGWTLHPELDLVWSPVFKRVPLKLSVYDNFRGYWGNYQMMYLGKKYVDGKGGHTSPGQVLDNKAGANLRYEFGQVALEVDAGYRLFRTADTLTSHFLQMGETEIRLLPLDPNRADYFYGGRIYVNAGQDRYWSLMSDRHKFGVNDMGADLRFGVPLGGRSRVLVDLGMETLVYSGALDAAATRAWLTPRYSLRWNSGFAELGAKVSYLKGSDKSVSKDAPLLLTPQVYQHKSDYIYPAVTIKQFLVPGRLAVYAKATGGDELNGYAEALRSNPFMDPLMVVPNLDASSVRLDASAGFEGDIAGRLQFDLHGGYAIHHNARCEAMEFTNLWFTEPEGGWKGSYLSGYYNYCDMNRWYGDASFLWKSPRMDVDGHVLFQHTDLVENGYIAVAPAPWTGELRATYNWNRQAFAGLSVGASSRRDILSVVLFAADSQRYFRGELAGWVDLGVHGSYVINPHWEVWAKAGNLLGQYIQHYFLHPEKGPYGTIGIRFNL